MAKIRRLGNRELRQVIDLLSKFAHDAATTHTLKRLQSLYIPFHTLNSLLPLSLKFMPEVFVASDEGRVLSLIWLSQDGHRRDCWKIDEIIINPETDSSLAVTKQLVQYSLSQLGARGVETFLAYLDVSSVDGIGLLKECGFRHCTRLHTWSWEASESISADDFSGVSKVTGLREATSWDIKQLQSLYSDSLPPEVRVSLRRLPSELHPSLDQQVLKRCTGSFYKAWVVPHSSQQYLLAYVGLSSQDYRDFRLHLIVSPGYDDELEPLLLFGVSQVLKNGSRVSVTLDCFDFQKSWPDILQKYHFESCGTTEILVKDVFVPLSEQSNPLTSPVLLFGKPGGRTSPARG
jgi:hypothetical protein